jgi:DNA-binding NarL/FixJ family response regulator
MPMMNGLELLEHIHRTPHLRGKSIPFIFLSTSGDRRYVEKAYNFSADGFFQKPAEIGELRKILKLVFDFWAKSLHPHHDKVDV